MKKEEYNKLMRELEIEYKNKRNDLIVLFAKKNNPIELGDTIEGMGVKIKVEKIHFNVGFGQDYPSCYYSGPKLRKDNTPSLNGDFDTIYQSRIETHIEN